MRTLEELCATDDPAIPLIHEWIDGATRHVALLPPGPRAPQVITTLQVTRRSTLGAMAFDTGGIIVDGGWLRLYGGGSDVMPRDLASWNGIGEGLQQRMPRAMVIAEDVLGGFFAIDGGGLGFQAGTVAYLSPDRWEWEDLGMSHTRWVQWAITGDAPRFYEGMRWPGWERDVAALPPDSGISVYPFLWAEGPPIAERSRRPVSIEELWGIHSEGIRR
jgi:hypothetical protein